MSLEVFLSFPFYRIVLGVLVLVLFKVWENLEVDLSGPGVFFFGGGFTTTSISLLGIDLFRFCITSSILVAHVCLEIYQFF
jgi:hypothetical protein